MKTALVTTTINVPEVLRLYRRFGPDVAFFIAGDEKSPHKEIQALLDEIGGENFYYTPGLQRDAGFAFSELVGWCNIQRRNFATLEALRWGADLIVSIDDDNFPLDAGHLIDFGQPFFGWNITGPDRDKRWSGLQAASQSGWVDPGQFLLPPVEHRGFPHEVRSPPVLSPIVDARVGVAQGYAVGDPDIGAVLRIAAAPQCYGFHEVARAGFVVDPRKAWAPFNSQNTAVIRELVPAFFMLPGVGRGDDILASFICQRIMQERGFVTHFGMPVVYQQRNAHSLTRDLQDEMFLVEHTADFINFLKSARFEPGWSVVEQVRSLFNGLQVYTWFPKRAAEAGLAWTEDCNRMLNSD